jgi:twitching motility protein PilJ
MFGKGKPKGGEELPVMASEMAEDQSFEDAFKLLPQGEAAAAPALAVPVPAPRRIGGVVERMLGAPLPLIGRLPSATQLEILLLVLVVSFFITLSAIVIDNRLGSIATSRISLVGSTMTQTQRMARAAGSALQGNRNAFGDLRESRDAIAADLDALSKGDSSRRLPPMTGDAQAPLARLVDDWRSSESAASIIIGSEKALVSLNELIKRIGEVSPRLQQLTEELFTLRVSAGGTPREIAAANQLIVLSQRMGRSAQALVAGATSSAESGLVLGRDINQFRDLAQALLSGNDALRIAPASDAESRARLQDLLKIYGEMQSSIPGALAGLQSVVQAKEAELTILRDSEGLRQQTLALLDVLESEQRGRGGYYVAIVLFGALALIAVLAIVKLLIGDARKRASDSDVQRNEAERLEQSAKQSNEQNQAAILRLMNELQEVADGNLTVQATVSEDITGAIADSVNYTVEELRGLVGRINETAEQVNTASTQARDIATRLLSASEAQSREIRDTGEKVLQMASQINDVSKSAGESAKVARASLEVAERGQRAVFNQISGMNEIREQIQETAKRIKRLGESSQEIGEIVELITDITEQTNVLALNAAIQAASAGDAGRGFSVVAEEVQRLADRSAEAAKQIGALVRTIQTDTQDAVAAMEKSTQGVVEGTKLSDAAGSALGDIGRVSRQLAELIERIASSTDEQAQSAGGVAQSIEKILTVTEQTSQGTRQAAQSIGQLATLARELKASVARFRVA